MNRPSIQIYQRAHHLRVMHVAWKIVCQVHPWTNQNSSSRQWHTHVAENSQSGQTQISSGTITSQNYFGWPNGLMTSTDGRLNKVEICQEV